MTMTNAKSTRIPQLSLFLIPFVLLIACVVVSFNPKFKEVPLLSWALAVDLMVTIPLLYWLLIRKRDIAKITVVPWVVGGIILAYHLVDAQNQPLTHYAFHYLLPVIELVVISLIGYKSVQLIRGYRAQESGLDFLNAIHLSAEQVFGKGLPAKLLAWELAVIYYGLFKWKHQPPANSFSYHRQAPIKSFLSAIMFLVVVETVVFHLLLQLWSTTAAWVLTGLSIYSLLWLIAQWKAMGFRPVLLEQEHLRIQHGLLFQTVIPLSNIVQISAVKSIDKSVKVLSLMPQMDSPNLKIVLKEPVEVQAIYGQTTRESALAIRIDHPEALCDALKIPSES